LIKKGIRLFSSKENFINDKKSSNNNNIFIDKLANNSNINNLKINKTINLSQNINLINKEKNINFKENKSVNNFLENKTNGIINPNIVSKQTTLNRLNKEFVLCQNDNDLINLGYTIGLERGDLFLWKATMPGPRDTPYEDGIFTILITFPSDYPSHGPEFRFKNKIYHLCVDPKNGHICIASINSWRTCGKVKGGQIYNVKRALIDIFCFFYVNDPDSAFSMEMAKQFRINKKEFDEEAKRWTKLFASF